MISELLSESPSSSSSLFCACLQHSCFGPLESITLFCEPFHRCANCSFHYLLDQFLLGFACFEQRAAYVHSVTHKVFLAMLIMLQFLHFFQPFCSFLRLSVHVALKLQIPETYELLFEIVNK